MGLLSYKGTILAPYLKVLNLEELTSCLEMILSVLTSLNGWNSEGKENGKQRACKGEGREILLPSLSRTLPEIFFLPAAQAMHSLVWSS